MSIPKKTVRSLRNIKTLSGRKDRTDTTYKTYMQLSSLEMEKVRLNNKKQSVLERLREIDARLCAIAGEEAALLDILGLPEAAAAKASTAPTETPGDVPDDTQSEAGGFKFQY